ncbi:uncharacterized protein A4U43_C07F29000 [Asparagus officinalis]|uniref:Isopenicillin N synthase-like Fe(2+) 2OG dioxygenase domain-containing protein n=1 Tax=Asparagus officinalis TaxID=4686 RepID=A0A5P1EG16_ASPOF|nr:uncharacterized protein A4U43_C07F29000 [Asparagus officinalis]
MFEEMEPLFALPAEAKRKAAEGTPQSSLVLPGQTPDAPLQQVFGAVGLQEPETAQALTDILWPDGNDKFCQALQSMNKKMGEMALVLKKMIFQSYGLGEYCDSNVDPTEIGFGMVRYSAPMTDEPTKGLSEHIDGTFITILCENDVDGLFTKSSKGEWHRVILKKNTFIVLAGFLLTIIATEMVGPTGGNKLGKLKMTTMVVTEMADKMRSIPLFKMLVKLHIAFALRLFREFFQLQINTMKIGMVSA